MEVDLAVTSRERDTLKQPIPCSWNDGSPVYVCFPAWQHDFPTDQMGWLLTLCREGLPVQWD